MRRVDRRGADVGRVEAIRGARKCRDLSGEWGVGSVEWGVKPDSPLPTPHSPLVLRLPPPLLIVSCRLTPTLRKQYTNTRYPMIVLRFEDGHEIRVPRGVGKSFEAFAGETIKIVAIWDPTSEERELV